MSISTDGRVTQWSTAKGLEHTDLMKLKRLARQAPAAGSAAVTGKLAGSGTVASGLGTKAGKSAAAAAAGEQDALVSRHSGGMSFDFSSRDHRIYLAGALALLDLGCCGPRPGGGGRALASSMQHLDISVRETTIQHVPA